MTDHDMVEVRRSDLVATFGAACTARRLYQHGRFTTEVHDRVVKVIARARRRLSDWEDRRPPRPIPMRSRRHGSTSPTHSSRGKHDGYQSDVRGGATPQDLFWKIDSLMSQLDEVERDRDGLQAALDAVIAGPEALSHEDVVAYLEDRGWVEKDRATDPTLIGYRRMQRGDWEALESGSLSAWIPLDAGQERAAIEIITRAEQRPAAAIIADIARLRVRRETQAAMTYDEALADVRKEH